MIERPDGFLWTCGARALQAIWIGIDLHGYTKNVAPALDGAFRETLALREMDDPDVVADRIVGAMVRQALARHGAARASLEPATSSCGDLVTCRTIGYWVGQTLVAEIVLSRAPAFTAANGSDADEICRTLAERLLELLDRRASGEDTAFVDGAMAAVGAFLETMAHSHEPLATRLWRRLRAGSTEPFGRDRAPSGIPGRESG